METLRSLIRGDLPPVGSPILLEERASALLQLEGYTTIAVNSGTAALAAALLNIKLLRPTILNPEVIVPAYCCPDLISACLYANCIPIVVDTLPDDTSYDSEQLKQAITPNCIALIAMTFLGIREDWSRLLPFMQSHYPNIALIEDNAQWFPELNLDTQFFADYMVFSFGRGKPVSLLGGGLLLTRQPHTDLQHAITKSDEPRQEITALKFQLYNRLLHPNIYWLLNHNPFFQPGKTQFHNLLSIKHLDSFRQKLFAANHEAYSNRSRNPEKSYDELFQSSHSTIIYPAIKTSRRERLLRYPILCSDKKSRDTLLNKLNHSGLGATAMYKNALLEIPQMSALINQTFAAENARILADRLITLPCHPGVTDRHIELIEKNLM